MELTMRKKPGPKGPSVRVMRESHRTLWEMPTARTHPKGGKVLRIRIMELAEAVGVKRRAAYQRLDNLVETGRVERISPPGRVNGLWRILDPEDFE